MSEDEIMEAESLFSSDAQPRHVHPSVLVRLQNLFPSARPSLNDSMSNERQTLRQSSMKSATPPKALKVKIVTWNMHDSLPKGDLEELLGKVPLWSPSLTSNPAFPSLALDSNHPYHFVVIAGQECPSASGMPMGLGAGFKLIDKEREKEREKLKDKSTEYQRQNERHRSKRHYGESPGDVQDLASGWTSLTENWLCNASGYGIRSRATSLPRVSSPKPLSPRILSKGPRRGPYCLLVKERMMGIYLAVYIHRELEPLVRGTSKSAVTAGLIGGRVGNKGGVGITVNLDGTTMLFLNAHLTAHEEKVHHRLANLAKIKAELSVDDFLSSDDPRIMAEDLSDKFDYTFLCGDLNFRLNITRLHADWLVSRRDYTQALAFDQLKALMNGGQAFAGFNEGPINFPPTFKYDVTRTMKKKRITKVEPQPQELSHRNMATEKDMTTDEGMGAEEEDPDNEAASVGSSVWSSSHSKIGTERGLGESFHAYPSSQTMTTSTSKTSVAHILKVRAKWFALFSPKRALRERHANLKHSTSHKSGYTQHHSVDVFQEKPSKDPSVRNLSADVVGGAARSASLLHITSTRSSLPTDEAGDTNEKGVYDSSNKQRVPSCAFVRCDRILWKSTVEPEPMTGEPEFNVKPRTRMSQFFVNAFRPISNRIRKDSSATASTTRSQETQTIAQEETPSESYLIESLDVRRKTGRAGPRRGSSATAVPGSSSVRHVTDLEDEGHSTEAEVDNSRDNAQPGVSLWRFLPSFLIHSSPVATTFDAHEVALSARKGDVVCLSYNTLDDRSMQRLGGRSDHRPVIGSYVVYL